MVAMQIVSQSFMNFSHLWALIDGNAGRFIIIFFLFSLLLAAIGRRHCRGQTKREIECEKKK